MGGFGIEPNLPKPTRHVNPERGRVRQNRNGSLKDVRWVGVNGIGPCWVDPGKRREPMER